MRLIAFLRFAAPEVRSAIAGPPFQKFPKAVEILVNHFCLLSMQTRESVTVALQMNARTHILRSCCEQILAAETTEEAQGPVMMSPALDMWALGCITYSIFAGKLRS